jgi:hypothetical protein
VWCDGSWLGSCHEDEYLRLSGLGAVLDAGGVASLSTGVPGLAKPAQLITRPDLRSTPTPARITAMSITRSPRAPRQPDHPPGLPAVRHCRRGHTVAVAGAALLAVLAASCGADDSPTATSIPSTTVAPATTTGQILSGTGYRLSLPIGWSDRTAAARNAGFKPDLVARKSGSYTHVDVILERNRGWTLVDYAAAGRQVAVSQLQARLGPVQQRSIAGAPAIGYEFTYSQDGRPVHSRQLNCFKGDNAYVITFTAYQQDFTADRAALDQILATWVWT